MHVINTRPDPDAAVFAARARMAGAVPVASPVLAIRFQDMPIPVGRNEALAFTSANGVRAFAQANPSRSARVFAVGEATATEARRAGFSDVSAADGDVESLADLVAAAKPTGPILQLAGNDQAGDLVALLTAQGICARRQILYAAAPVLDLSPEARDVLAASRAETAVALFSPRSAALFYAQLGRAGLEDRLAALRLLAFSEATAAAALRDRWGRVEIAAARTMDAMIALVAR